MTRRSSTIAWRNLSQSSCWPTRLLVVPDQLLDGGVVGVGGRLGQLDLAFEHGVGVEVGAG